MLSVRFWSHPKSLLKKTEEVGNIPESTIETNLLDRKVLTVQEIRPLSHHWYFAHTSRNPHHQLLFKDGSALTHIEKERHPELDPDAALVTYAVNQCPLRDLNGLGYFLLRFGLRHRDGQDAVLHLG